MPITFEAAIKIMKQKGIRVDFDIAWEKLLDQLEDQIENGTHSKEYLVMKEDAQRQLRKMDEVAMQEWRSLHE